jgi:hypothetical protein
MGRLLDVAGEPIDRRHADWELCQLSVFADWPVIRPEPDSDAQRALRELKGRHAQSPLPAVDAHAEAMAVLEEHDALGAFAAWKTRQGSTASYWPTSDSRRIRAV